MKVEKIETILNISNFKNKEEVANRIIQEVITICKENLLFFDLSKNNKLNNYKETLIEKKNKLDTLLKKSNDMKIKVTNKTKVLVEINNNLKKKILQFIENKEDCKHV